jgi:hypothetical protein
VRDVEATKALGAQIGRVAVSLDGRDRTWIGGPKFNNSNEYNSAHYHHLGYAR